MGSSCTYLDGVEMTCALLKISDTKTGKYKECDFWYNREIQIKDGNAKDDVKMANKWRDVPFIRYSHVVFDVSVFNLNLSEISILCYGGV